MMTRLLLISAAGCAGTLCRYGLSLLVHRHAGPGFPWGTLVINLSGCFAFGIAWSIAESRLSVTSDARAMVLIGFMGAYTTFSSFAFETTMLLRDAQWGAALANMAVQNVMGVALLMLGMAVGRHV